MRGTSGLVKLVLGFVIAIALLVSGSVALALIFINRASSPPPKPIFANDSSAVKKTVNTTKPKTSTPVATKKAPKTKPSPSPLASLASGSYPARVTWNQGLSLRAEPSLDAERIGSLDYNQKITVLQQSKDKKWQQIRLDDSELQGWVKAGNTERVN